MEPVVDDRKNSWITGRAVWWVVAGYMVVWAVYGFITWNWLGDQKAGLFGDTFGAFNAFVSGLAMLGVVAAIFLQRDQIRMQAEELELQRKELQATTQALNEQARLMRDETAFNVLTALLVEYRRPDMLEAVAALWEHWRRHPNDLVEAYEAERQNSGKLHAQRRLVSQFYAWLAGLRQLGVVPPDVLYRHWRKSDLSIIPEVLLPIELHLEKTLSWPTEVEVIPVPEGSLLESMRRLFDESPTRHTLDPMVAGKSAEGPQVGADR